MQVKLEQGVKIIKIFKDHSSKACILDDFGFYEARQKSILEKKAKQQQFQKQARYIAFYLEFFGQYLLSFRLNFVCIFLIFAIRRCGKESPLRKRRNLGMVIQSCRNHLMLPQAWAKNLLPQLRQTGMWRFQRMDQLWKLEMPIRVANQL